MNNKELTLDKALQNDRKSYNRGYDSCKKKVLDILKDKILYHECKGDVFYYINLDKLGEIEKL